MPRERSSKPADTTSGAAKKPKKTVRKTAAKKAAKKTTARKRTTKPKAEAAIRKAPTTTSKVEIRRPFPKLIVGCLVTFLVIAGGSVYLGVSDSGEINVASVVEERKEEARLSGDDSIDRVSVPRSNVVASVPNGGLTGKGKSAPPKKSPGTAIASTTVDVASSTEAIASSTDSGTEEIEGEAEADDIADEEESETENTELLEEDTTEATSTEPTV